MPDPITFGDILIHDINGNDQFDPKIDLVTDVLHQEIPSHEKNQKLQQILKQLNKPNWKGIILNPAGAYITEMLEAKKQAEEGEPPAVQQSLIKAKESAAQGKIFFNEKEANEILKKALLKGIEKCRFVIDHPSNFQPMTDNIEEIKGALKSLEKYTEEYNLRFKGTLSIKKSEAEQILQKAYTIQIPDLAKELVKYAKMGSIFMARELVKNLTTHMADAKKRFNLDFPYNTTWMNQQFEEALTHGIPREWKKAEQDAKKGQTTRVRRILARIRELIQEGNQKGLFFKDDPRKEEAIMEEALREGIEDNYKLATKYALQRNLSRARFWIEKVKEYIHEYNIGYRNIGSGRIFFDHEREEKIIKCAKGLAPCP